MKNNNKGFTIIELIIVVTIIIILAGVVTAGVINYIKKAQATRIITEMGELKKAFTAYYIDNGKYPYPDGGTAEDNAINFLTGSLVDSKYISKIPEYADDSQLVPYAYYVGSKTDGAYCGGIPIKDYVFNFQNDSLDLNFPQLTKDSPDSASYLGYCIGQ
jgi:prepilin-type N-terminal cleavage/methylation domain-containing protein